MKKAARGGRYSATARDAFSRSGQSIGRSLGALKLAEDFCRVFSEGPSFEDDITQGVLERAAQPASNP